MTLQDILLKLARAAIEESFGKPFSFSKEILMEQFPELAEDRATFVTIYIDGDSVRGCIGSLLPHATLFDDVIYNAKAAAFSDNRFFPLSEGEYPYCSIEVSLLSLPEALPYSDADDLRSKIRPGVDGVILQLGERSGTFLPQVWDEFPSFDHFFGQLGLKAGIRGFALDRHPRIFTYQAERFADTPLEEEYEVSADTPFATPQAAEAGYYGAFERGDAEAMLSVWAEDDAVVCVHPGGECLQGREAVAESWRGMLAAQQGQGLRVELEEVHAAQEGQLGIRTVRERIFAGGRLAGVALATNVYRLEEGGWRMLMHHASPDPSAWR